jgi:O-antigen ligase
VSARRPAAILDAAGVALVVLLAGVAVGTAAARGGDARPIVVLLLGVAAALVLGRLLGSVHRAIVPTALVVIAAILVPAAGALDHGPLGGPFGYRNATGAFFVQAVAAALIAAVAVRSTWVRVSAAAAALAFAAVAVSASAASAAGVAVAVASLMAIAGSRIARATVVAVAAVFLIVLVGTVAVGAVHRPGSGSAVERALTERRVQLWHESLALIVDQPAGVGPGRFADVDPTARGDRDARWAHQGFLQQGVELGWAGLALTILLFAWGFMRLWVHPAPDAVVAMGAASLAALGIQASIDYVLHFPAVPLAAAALAGTAQAVSRRRSRDADDPRPQGLEGGAHAAGLAGAPTPG